MSDRRLTQAQTAMRIGYISEAQNILRSMEIAELKQAIAEQVGNEELQRILVAVLNEKEAKKGVQ